MTIGVAILGAGLFGKDRKYQKATYLHILL
jgi:hypothetical protein